MISPTRLKFLVAGLIVYFAFQWMLQVGVRSTENPSTWLGPALIGRKNSQMEIHFRGEGALVKKNRKIIIETEKSPVSGIFGIHKFGFILGVDEPDFVRRHADALVGLKEGAIARIPEKDLKFKVLKVCHDQLPDSSKCDISPLDQPVATKLSQCLEPKNSNCQELILKLIMSGNTEEPEYPFIEYCVVESEFSCLKLIQALAYTTQIHPDLNGRLNPAAEGSLLYLSDAEKLKAEELILSEGSTEFAGFLLTQNPQDLKPEQILRRFEAAEKNPPVYEKMTRQYLDIIQQNAYNADRVIDRLKESGAKLPPAISQAIELRRER